jgi:parvulin-like peptidyl-prolyl isomerase
MMLVAAALVAAAAVSARAQGAGAQPPAEATNDRILDQIVATVDDQVILLSDLLADLQLYVMQSGEMPGREEQAKLLEDFRESRVQEKLLVAKAHRDELEVGEQEVDKALDDHIARLKEQAGGDERFQQQLGREGLTERDLRKRLRPQMQDQLLTQRLIERRHIDATVNDEEARAFFEAHKDSTEIIPRRPVLLMLSHLMVLPRPDAEREAPAQALIQQAQARLAKGEDFAAVARELSQGPGASRGGDMGWMRLQDIALPDLRAALASLPTGQVSPPVSTEQGIHLLQVTERSDAEGTLHFRQIFVALPLGEEDMNRARELARAAWQRLRAGERWEDVVAATSDDTRTRDSGGKLPPIAEPQLDDRYRDIVAGLEPGEYSGVFQGERGFQIVRLDGREESRPYRYEEIADQLRDELSMKKRNEAILAYLAELETQIFVDRKPLPSIDEIAGMTGQR